MEQDSGRVVVVVGLHFVLGDAEATPMASTLTADTAMADTMMIRFTAAPWVLAMEYEGGHVGRPGRWVRS
jgi:hypothetical protein